MAAAQPGAPSIAVLPFDDMSREKDQDYFCEGMAEEIINALTGLEGLHVAARTSAFQAKAKGFDIVEIGSRLNVGAVLEGSVRTAGNRLRVTAQLINVSDGYHLWSERYDREMDDVFTVQDEIARAVVDKLKVKLLGEQDVPVIERPTGNLEAYHLVLKGRYHALKLTKPALERGLECFTQALVLEPAYAQAHAGIATIQALRSILSFGPPLQLMPTAKEASLKALEINDTVADAHGALALVLHLFDQVTGVDLIEKALRRAHERVQAAGVDMQLIEHERRIGPPPDGSPVCRLVGGGDRHSHVVQEPTGSLPGCHGRPLVVARGHRGTRSRGDLSRSDQPR